jgi:PhzF family phenazine biosynthesis protein
MNKKAITVNVINAFIDAGRGGNPAGVVLDADHLGPDARQQIAAQAGLSETAFVSSSAAADFRLEFFTPTRQIPHCGHATVATFSYLAQQGRVAGPESSKETIDGRREIFLQGDLAFMEQLAPRYRPLPDEPGVDTAAVLASLNLAESDLLPGRRPLIVNTGNSFLIVPLAGEAALAAIRPDQPAIHRISDRLDLIGYYPFTLTTQVAGRDAAARMFAPRYGIPEESATGMAAGPLACYLYDHLAMKQAGFVIEQGRLMVPPSPSELQVELTLDQGQITRLMAGGRAKLMKQIQIEIMDP